MSNSLLDGYVLESGYFRDLPLKSVKDLEDEKSRIKMYDSFLVYIYGLPYKATRDPSFKYELVQTEQKQVLAKDKWKTFTNLLGGRLTKRQYVGFDQEEECVPSKKRRVVNADSLDVEMILPNEGDLDDGYDNFDD